MLQELDKLEKYFFCDPASGKGRLKKARARQAIIGIAVDHLARIFVVFSWAGKIRASDLRDKIVRCYEQWKPRAFGIEANAMQDLFGDLVIARAKEVLGHARIVDVYQSTKIEKDFRIRTTLEPVLNDGRLFVPGKFIELRTEMTGFPTAATKDLVDALSSAISLIPRRAVVASSTGQEEASEYAAFLRGSGVPPWQIEERLAQFTLNMRNNGGQNG